MPGREHITGDTRIDTHLVRLVPLHKHRFGKREPVSQPLNTVSDQQRASVRLNIDELCGQVSIVNGSRHIEHYSYGTRYFEVATEWRRSVNEDVQPRFNHALVEGTRRQ